MPSRFLEEIPEETREWLSKPEPKSERHWSDEYLDDDGYRVDITAAQHRQKVKSTLDSVRKAATPSVPLLDLKPGEGVKHSAFGHGMVLSVRPMGGDALSEVAFDNVGTKKLMLKAAMSHLSKD